MGISILDSVVQRLQAEGFEAGEAYPGQKFPLLTKPAAAVHMEKVDRTGMTVTLEINILCPGSMGGTQCELEALRATNILRKSGADCVQNGCTYDGLAQAYSVQILATFVAVTEADSYTLGPGFYVFIDNICLFGAVSFTAERQSKHDLHFAMGETDPVGSSRGEERWLITVEELLLPGDYIPGTERKEFTVRVEKSARFQEVYSGCRWISQKKQLTREGIRRIRTGIAMSMEESLIGENEL